MRKITKRGSVIAGILAAALIAGGCQGAKFDASAYVKACMDASYHGEFEEYAEMLDISENKAKAELKTQNQESIDRELAAMPEATDEQKEKYLELTTEIQKLTKYEVGEAKETDDGYEVPVTVEPLDVYEVYVEAIPGKAEQAVADGTYDESQIISFLMEVLEESIDQASYKEKTETTVQVTKDSDGVWQITEDEMLKLTDVLLPGLE